MVKETLVGLDIEGGEKILAALDEAKFPVAVALWMRAGEDDDWNLVLASPLYEKRDANLKMVLTLWPLHLDWVHAPIRLESTRQPFIRALRQRFGKVKNVEGTRLRTRMIGDRWVQEAYIYRIR